MLPLNNMLEQINLTHMSRKFHPKSKRIHSLLKRTCNISKVDHSMPQVLINFKSIEIISNIFFNHNGMELEVNYMEKTGKFTSIWRLNNVLLNNQWSKKNSKEKPKEYLETDENRNVTYPNSWAAA